MHIHISGRAEVTVGDKATADPAILRQFDGAASDDECGNYIDMALAELGVSGGIVRLAYAPRGENAGFLQVVTEYESPIPLAPDQLERLVQDTVAQWSDGIGEGCFDDLAEEHGVGISLAPHGGAIDLRVEQVDDGRAPWLPKTAVAIAARNGDLDGLRRRLEAGAEVDALLQRFTALQLAVIYGHAEAALLLIDHGADVNVPDAMGDTPLMRLASTQSMSDADAARVATRIIEQGASVYGAAGPDANPEPGQYTPLYMAELRGKTELAAVLRRCGAFR